jgi:universal stress protein A
MYSTFIHATDLSESHYGMCEEAKGIADKFNAKLYLMHVIEPPASLQLAQSLGFAEFDMPQADDAISVMRVLGESLGIPKEQLIVEVGSIKSKVLKKIDELRCDIIILGKRSPDALHHLLGSTAHAVSHQASCHVLTLHP